MQRFDTPSLLRRGLGFAAIAIAGLTVVATVRSQPSGASGSWTAKAPLPVARNEVAAVALNDRIYVLGGAYPRQKYDVADNGEYDPAADRWRARAPLPHGLNHVGAAALNGKIYVVGGFTGSNHKSVNDGAFEYDPATDTWRALPPLPSPRGSVAVAALAGKLHALGGRKNENDVVTAHEIYDPATGKWSAAAPLPRGRDHMAAVVLEGKIHLVGGRFGANEDMTGLHDIYDPATNAWTAAPPVPTPRGGGAGTLFQGMIVFLGGEDDNRTYDENEGFELKSNRWVRLAPMPTGRHGFGAAALGKYLQRREGTGRRRSHQRVPGLQPAVAVSEQPRLLPEIEFPHLRPVAVHGRLVQVERRLCVGRQHGEIRSLPELRIELAPRSLQDVGPGQKVEDRCGQRLGAGRHSLVGDRAGGRDGGVPLVDGDAGDDRGKRQQAGRHGPGNVAAVVGGIGLRAPAQGGDGGLESRLRAAG